MRLKIYFIISGLLISHFAFTQNFIKREGRKLKFQDKEIYLRGMAFGNLVWDDSFSPTQHHSEIDYQRLQDLGMNAIRFYMNYKTFEDDSKPYTYRQSGFDWIDQNIQWAKKHNIYLILNMHVPPGGFQSRCEGNALWENSENQDRLVALWKAIADKYKDEPQIAGFDLLNEPNPVTSVQTWTELAQRIIDGIRTADKNHLIITERANALNCDYGYSDANNNYPQVTEENLMYTVHLYDPFEFTHQNLAWAGTGDGGSYPDPSAFTLPGDLTYATGHYSNPTIESGNSDWQYYEGNPYTVTEDSLLVGRIVFLSNGINNGKVYYDDFKLIELDENDDTLRVIYDEDLSSGNFWWWSKMGDGSYSASNSGHGDNYSVSVSGNSDGATVIAQQFTFRVYPGRKYVTSGWMKGENIPAGASATISTEFYASPSHQKVGIRDHNNMRDKIISYTKYAEENNFPVFFGEFGAARTCFVNDKGGERWVADAMKIFDSLGYNFTYHSYKESSFGYYDGWEQPVDPATVNLKLEKVFREYFHTTVANSTISESDRKHVFKLFPNPVTNSLSISNQENTMIESVEITNSTGDKKIEIQGNPGTVNLENLSPGLYLISIKTKDSAWTERFIKID